MYWPEYCTCSAVSGAYLAFVRLKTMEVETNVVWPFSVKRMLRSQRDAAGDDENSTSTSTKNSAKKKPKKGAKKKSFRKKLDDVSSTVSSERRDSTATKEEESSSSKLSLSFRKDKRKQAVKDLIKAFDVPLDEAMTEKPLRSEWMRFAMWEPSIQSILCVYEPLNPP